MHAQFEEGGGEKKKKVKPIYLSYFGGLYYWAQSTN